MPSATAAFVALIASSNASLRDFISASDGAPTRTTATPPDELREALLELLAVVVALRLLDLPPELLDAPVDRALVAARRR